ncbi:MAG TPA: YciI family protein, partial [Thermomicrobiales bacterium]|nr:YciI family protein [Thermomicrobiales bacterium]
DANGVAYSGGSALFGPDAARTVRKKNGEFVVTDGPYADLKEVVGGFYVIDAPDAAAAAEIAKHCPMDSDSGIEVRPFWEH